MNFKKIKINKVIRLSILFIFIIIISLSTYQLYSKVMHTDVKSENISQYAYSNNANINYTIFLKPNNLYNGYTLNEGKLYISKLVDSIDTNFIYEFSAEKKAELKGTYTIIAKVEGFTTQNDNKLIIWEKEFPISRTKKFNIVDRLATISENIKLDLNEYNTLIEEIIETTKINCDTTLTLLMDVNLTGTTDKGIFKENITPSLVIPLNTPLFEITKNNIENPGTIEETIQVPIPVDKGRVIFYSAILGICAISLIFLLFFTEVALEKDKLERELKKIFKKHGDRLVALTNEPKVTEVRNVRSMDDLVRLADEINKPILYRHSEDYKELNKFYVINDSETYIFDLTDLFTESVLENEDDLQINTEEIKIES